MNLRGARALVKRTWLSWMQERGFFFLLAFMWMIPPLVYLFVWSTAAAGRTIGGMTRGQFVGYYLVLISVNQITYSTTNWTVGDVIRMGSFSAHLLRPMSPVFDALASEVAGKVVFMTFNVPATLLLALVLRPELRLSAVNVLAFIPALLLAWALRFVWGYWLALLAFWATRANALLALQDSLVFLLAGQVAPMALLPTFLQRIAIALPFRYMVGFPVEILAGQLDAVALRTGFAIQIGWLCLALVILTVVWRQGVRRYSAVGG